MTKLVKLLINKNWLPKAAGEPSEPRESSEPSTSPESLVSRQFLANPSQYFIH